MNLNTYLVFNGNCEEAMQFYAQCLGGKLLEVHRYGGSPMDNGELPEAQKNKVMHTALEAEGQHIMASDAGPGQPASAFGGFSVSVGIQDPARAKRIFEALSAGGRIDMPFQKTFWAQGFGMLTDRFGVPWMVNCEG